MGVVCNRRRDIPNLPTSKPSTMTKVDFLIIHVEKVMKQPATRRLHNSTSYRKHRSVCRKALARLLCNGIVSLRQPTNKGVYAKRSQVCSTPI